MHADERESSPHAQEIEYALVLSRMINAVKDDPSQMRLTVYEFARARLKIDTLGIDESERKRLAAALETAIQGVEEFSRRRGEEERLQSPNPTPQIAREALPVVSPIGARSSVSPLPVKNSRPITPASENIFLPEPGYARPDLPPVEEVNSREFASSLARLFIGATLFIMVAVIAYHKDRLAYYRERLPSLHAQLNSASQIRPTDNGPLAVPQIADAAQPAVPTNDLATASAPSHSLSFPLPSDYGVYAVSDGSLNELYPLAEQVPDKRIAMSTPVSQSTRTVLPNGKLKFVIFRRDLSGNPLDRIDIRIVARVVRALTFDANGKRAFLPVSDAWNIRNIGYEFRVRPVAGSAEMVLVQPDKSDFVLPAGRYVLAVKNQGYDFTVAGKITDLAQCLERTDAANGEFYSECQKL